MKRENCLLIIAGPSAVGKTTVAYSLIERDPRFEFVRSVTTRPKRGDSFDNEYIYLTIPEFITLRDNGGVLEHTEYAGNFYGTPRSEVERILSEGKIPLLVLDMNGVGSLVKNASGLNPCGVYVYDSLEVMAERLRARFLHESHTDDDLRKYHSRIKQNITDYSVICEKTERFFAFIPNKGTLADTVTCVSEVFAGFCDGAERDSEAVESVAAALAQSVSKA